MTNNPFQNLSIRNKLFVSHFTILLVTLSIIYITIRVNNKSEKIGFIIEKVEQIRINAQEQTVAKQDFLINERYNEDFFKTGNSVSIGRYIELLNRIDENIKQINRNELSKKQQITTQILTITNNFHELDKLFKQMVDSVKQLGFGNMGLMGSLKNYLNELSSNKLVSKELLTTLHQQEINYLLYKDETALIQFDSIASIAMKIYKNSPSSVLILREYQKNFNRVVRLEKSITNSKFEGLSNEFIEKSKKNNLQVQITIDTIKEIYQNDIAKLNWIFMGLIGATFVIGGLMSYALAVQITNPIINLNAAVKDVVAIQFKENINPKLINPLRKDEIGELTKNFNLAIRKIKKSIQIIQDKSNTLQQKNNELIANQEILKKVNSQKDKFLSIISHDMRAPLSSIISFLDYYKNNINSFTETEFTFVSTNLNLHVKKVVEMLDGLLLWSRSQTREIQTTLAPIDLSKSIIATIDILNQTAENKKIIITTNLHNQLVWADENMTTFIIRNIVSNAIKFTKEGGSIKISTMRNKRNAFIIIKDDGVGISKDNLAKLFKDDNNYSTFGTNNEKGIGLGLALCKDFMNLQNGDIEIESIIGEGTTVNLLFPLVSVGIE